jgi:YfiH family protein
VERRRLDRDLFALVASGLERRGFLAAFAERTGGESEDPYRSLNLGFRTGDDHERVRRNRERLVASLGVPPFALSRQVHGVDAVRVGPSQAGAGFADPGTVLPEADVVATTARALPMAVLVADCLPVALASDAEGLLVGVHAGWRGLAGGILGRAVALFRDPARVAAALGPAIGPCHYEVGVEVVEAVAAGSSAGAVWERRHGRIYLDLGSTAIGALGVAGVQEVEDAAVCAACQRERFYSNRRDGLTGRQAMVAMRL